MKGSNNVSPLNSELFKINAQFMNELFRPAENIRINTTNSTLFEKPVP